MKILAVDDEKIILELVVRKIKEAAPKALVIGCENGEESIEKMREQYFDVVFLDINMRPMDGVLVAKRMKEINPMVNIIFLTGYTDYALDAMQLRSSGYLLKPPTVEKIKEELSYLRNPITKDDRYLMKARCFGTFELYDSKNQIVRFSRLKSKEIIAYLIDRKGAAVTASEICAVLWEDETDWTKQQNYFYKLTKDIRDTFDAIGAGEVLHKGRNQYALLTEFVECDYFQYLDMMPEGIRAYNGEYMSQYSWAEVTRGSLE